MPHAQRFPQGLATVLQPSFVFGKDLRDGTRRLVGQQIVPSSTSFSFCGTAPLGPRRAAICSCPELPGSACAVAALGDLSGDCFPIQSWGHAGLAGRHAARKGHPVALEPYRGLRQLDEVHHVGQVIEDQFFQGRPVAATIPVPQLDRLKTVHALDCWVSMSRNTARSANSG